MHKSLLSPLPTLTLFTWAESYGRRPTKVTFGSWLPRGRLHWASVHDSRMEPSPQGSFRLFLSMANLRVGP